MTQILEHELFSPDFLQNNPELLKIQEVNVEVDEKLASALIEYENIKKQISQIHLQLVNYPSPKGNGLVTAQS